MQRNNVTALLFLTCVLILPKPALSQSSPPGTGTLSMSNPQATHVKTLISAPPTTVTAAAGDHLIGIESPGILTGVANQIPSTAILKVRSYSSNAYTIPVQPQITALTPTPATDFTVDTSNCQNPYISQSPIPAPAVPSLDSAPQICTLTLRFSPTQIAFESVKIVITLQPIGPGGASDTVTLTINGIGTASCPPTRHSIMPLIPSHADTETLYCYYNSTSFISAAKQVTYLYNPVGDTNSIGADLLSGTFVGGLQLTLDAIASQNNCTATSSTSAPSGNATCTQTSGGSGQSPQQAASTLSTGGQFGVRLTYPFIDWRNRYFHGQLLATPRFSANINGLGGQQTPTSSTNFVALIPAEGYFEWDALAPPGSNNSQLGLYVDVRSGLEHVASDYAATVGLQKIISALHKSQLGCWSLAASH